MTARPGISALILALLLSAGAAGTALAKGDPERGRRLSRECFACHGQDGYSPSPINPKIGGQHERYLYLALKEYRDGGRAHSLMRGSVLSRSDHDLEDIAAYYAAQPGYLTAEEIRQRREQNAPPNSPPPTSVKSAGSQQSEPQQGGPPPGAGAPRSFDHSDHIARYNSMLSQAMWDAARASAKVDDATCAALSGNDDSDRDRDGLADAFDSAPDDPGEFVLDTNGDGFYEICNIRQLEAIGSLGSAEGASTVLEREARMTRNYQVVRDLDASAVANFEPIGDCGPEGNCMITLDRYGFQGVIDGQGHTIRGLRISRPGGGGIGLLGVLGARGTVRNLVIEDAVVIGRGGVALLVGSNFGMVYRCRAEGEVAGELALGLLVGGSGGLVAFSESSGRVSGNQAIGGLIGDMRGAVYNSRSNAAVSGSRGLGGLVGLNTFGLVLNSYAAGSLVGGNDLGGLVGMNTDAKVRNSYSTANVEGEGSNIGGLVGFNSLSGIRNSYAAGKVFGADAVGGLVGRNNGSVRRSYASGQVRSAGSGGGISGFLVDADENDNFWSAAAGGEGATNLMTLTAADSGWSPASSAYLDLIDVYCDSNFNGFIDPEERSSGNYVWEFGDGGEPPALRCAANAGVRFGGR